MRTIEAGNLFILWSRVLGVGRRNVSTQKSEIKDKLILKFLKSMVAYGKHLEAMGDDNDLADELYRIMDRNMSLVITKDERAWYIMDQLGCRSYTTQDMFIRLTDFKEFKSLRLTNIK